jgi:hypothetical protein
VVSLLSGSRLTLLSALFTVDKYERIDGWIGRGVLTKIFRIQTFIQRRKGVDPLPIEDLVWP